MQKSLAGVLAMVSMFNASVQSAAASVPGDTKQSASLRMQRYNLPLNTASSAQPLATSLIAGYAGVKSLTGDPTPQTTPTSTQNRPAHHSHHVRDAVIIITLGAVLLIALAAAAK